MLKSKHRLPQYMPFFYNFLPKFRYRLIILALLFIVTFSLPSIAVLNQGQGQEVSREAISTSTSQSPTSLALLAQSPVSPQIDSVTESETDSTIEPEPRVLVAEVAVSGAEGDLQDTVYGAVSTRPGRTTTRSQLQEDINAIFATGFFSNVRATPEDTPLGVRVTFDVVANPALESVQLSDSALETIEYNGEEVSIQQAIDEIFSPLYDNILNLRDLQVGIEQLNQLYRDNGYVLAQVISAPSISPDGVVTLQVAEGEIENIEIRFLNDEGESTDEEGNPVQGRTRDFIITREFESLPGDVFNYNQIQADLQRAFGLGIFEDLSMTLTPGLDPRKVNVVVNVTERNTASLAAGIGFRTENSTYGFLDFQESNLNGRSQRVAVEVEIGESESSLNASLTSPGVPEKNLDQSPLLIAGIAALDAASDAQLVLQRKLIDALLDPDRLREVFSDIINSNSDSLLLNNSSEQFLVVSKFQEALRIAEQEDRTAEAALTLNNLGNFYVGIQKYKLAVDTYQEALEKFQELNSPAFELLTWLRIANLHRTLGQPSQALGDYYKALEAITHLRSEKELENVFGKEVLNALIPEWQINTEYLSLDNEIALFSSLFESAILLDIGATYSALGDYQQSLYVVNSTQLKESIQDLSLETQKLVNNLVSAINVDSVDVSDDSPIDEETLSELSNRFKNSVGSLIEKFPDLTRWFALRFIYSDLNENLLADFYRTESRQEFGNLRNYALVTLRDLFNVVVDNPNLLNIKDQEFKEIILSGGKFLFGFFDFVNTSNSAQEVLSISFKKEVESITDSLISYLSGFGDGVFQSESLAEIKPLLETLIYNLAQPTNDDDNETVGNKIFGQELVEISQIILRDWPSNNRNFQNLEWAKGVVYLIQGLSYYELGEYQKSADSYELYFQSSSELEDTLDALFDELNLEPDQTSYFKQFASFFVDFVKKSKINTHLRTAEIYFKLEQPSQSKSHYENALSLSQELFEEESVFFLTQAEIAEIYYGIALADSLLKDFERSQKAIETAIFINDNFFPKKSLSGGTGFTTVGLRYGYGESNRGSLFSEFRFSSNNPWTTPQSSQSNTSANNSLRNSPVSVTRGLGNQPCTTPATYFACRQKYFDLYIDLLVQRHREAPLEGFNILAFEQSEQARVRGSRIFQNSPELTELPPERQPLLQRRALLNEPASLNNIKQVGLNEGTLLLEYFLGENKSYLWLVSKEKPLQTFELPPRSVIEAKAREFYTLLTEPSGRVRPQKTTTVGQELSAMILAPLADQLGEQRLLIVGDGFLQYIPFSVLPNPLPNNVSSETASGGEFAPHLKPLILDHEIITLPSASSLVAIRRDRQNRSEPDQELAIVAAPVFNHEDDRVNQVMIGSEFTSFKQEELETVDLLYGALSGTAEELASIEKLLPAPQRKSFSGYDANLSTVLSPELGQFRIVHFASHGIFNSQSPERSGVVLSGINEQGLLQPGLLSPLDAFNNMDLSGTELVVLSGCRTGISNEGTVREGLTGFTGGLLSAGTDRIVASLWSVQDQATSELMSRFYQRLLDRDHPMTSAQALRSAQISMWEEPRWQTPYYWAAFIIQGEWQ